MHLSQLIKRGILCLKKNGLWYSIKKFFYKTGKWLRKRLRPAKTDIPPTASKLERWASKLDLKEDRLNIGFVIGGGFGDNLIFANYLYCFLRKFKGIPFQTDVYFENGFNLARSLFRKGDMIRRYERMFSHDIFQCYDLFIWVNRYPQIMNRNAEKIVRFSHELIKYTNNCKKFEENNKQYFYFTPFADTGSAVLSEINGITRIQQPDIYGMLGIRKAFDYPLFIREDETEYLAKLGLQGRRFITLHRGSDAAFSENVVKLWPLHSYNELISMLSVKYPDIILVQLGVSRDRCPPMKGIHIDLVGKTTMEQIKVLLKCSLLHIDAEGGFVHLRNALSGGKSVVLFGSTSMAFYAYEDNINIKGDGCPQACEWVSNNWLDHCARGFKEPPCMASITPAMVMEKIQQKIR